MKKIMVLSLCLLLAAGFAVFAGGSGESGGPKPLVITLAHGAPEDHCTHLGWLKVKEIIESGSQGAMKLEIHPAQQMGGDREVTEATQIGDIQLGHTAPSVLGSFVKEFFVLDAPFLFKTREDVYKSLDGDGGKKLLSYLDAARLKGLGYMENGFRNLTANKAVRSPADLRGVKVRVMESEIQILTWSSLGANPTPMAFGELFTALQQKTVDAQENPIEFIYMNKLHEVQSHLMTTRHLYSPVVLLANLDFYNKLTSEQKTLLDKGIAEGTAVNRKVAAENELKARGQMEKTVKFIELGSAELQAFQDKMGPVYAAIRKKVANDTLCNLFFK
ncbi:MAG: TRAP transporter substrate-binding protein [Spirochaetia bacterium]|jgi:tripartite ATP-independent transporter DctP family solute receptor|nr:TRAP transporter substrate-binding protein [Spirochaetia bacterium]